MKNFAYLILVYFTASIAFAATYVTGDAVRSPDRTKIWTFPAATDTILGRTSTDTLTNKSMSGSSNTFTSIPNSATTAVSTNTNSAIVTRDGSGNFSAGTITAALTGNASTATALSGSLTNHSVLLGQGTGIPAALAVPASGTVLTGVASSDPAFSATPTLGVAGTTLGSLALAGNTSGAVTIKPQAAAGTYNFNLPITAGTSGYALTSGGGGSTAMGWTSVLSNPMSAFGDLIYGGSSGAPTALAAGLTGQILQSSSTLAAPIWRSFIPRWMQALTSGTTYNHTVAFTVTSASATVGATYTNSGVTFTVSKTIASGTLLYASGNAAPGSSGTLTKASGTGDSTITFSSMQEPIFLHVRLVGAGGGGGQSGTAAGTAGQTGGTTTFGSSMLSGVGGSGGALGSPGGGGAASLGTGPIGLALSGGSGVAPSYTAATVTALAGGQGATSPFGGAGSSNYSGTGTAAVTNSGSGGGGGGANGGVAINNSAGGGGGSGGYVDAIIISPSATYTYAIGAGGTAGVAGTSGNNGGTGGSGLIIVEENYQ